MSTSENAHKSIFLNIVTPRMRIMDALTTKHRNGMGWATPSGRGAGKVTRGLNYMAVFDEMREPRQDSLWDFTAKHVDRSVYFRPVWAGTKIPVEMVYTHNSSFDTELLGRQIAQQAEWYYDTMTVTTGRQYGKDYTLKKLADKMMSDEAYEAMRYKTILPPWLYGQGVEMFGEDYMSGCIPYSSGPWNSREEKQEAFRRAYGLPDHSQIYGDPIEGLSTGRFATNARKD